MRRYYFEIVFENKSEIHWTKNNSVDNARDAMWDRYRKAILIRFIREVV